MRTLTVSGHLSHSCLMCDFSCSAVRRSAGRPDSYPQSFTMKPRCCNVQNVALHRLAEISTDVPEKDAACCSNTWIHLSALMVPSQIRVTHDAMGYNTPPFHHWCRPLNCVLITVCRFLFLFSSRGTRRPGFQRTIWDVDSEYLWIFYQKVHQFEH